ncbi:MAG TPA: hypothetical protein VF941_17080, partial [Clostridia bacterium]
MKKQLKYSLPVTLCLFIAMTSITVGAGYYKNSVSKESASFSITLPTKKKVSDVVINLANQGIPKKLVQPRKISISSGHAGGITNKGTEPLSVMIKAEGFKGNVNLSSTDPSFNPETGIFSKPLIPNQSFGLEVDLNIPKECQKEYNVCNGVINFVN